MLPDRPSRKKYCYGLSRSAADRAPAETAVASSAPHCFRTVAPFPRAAGQTFPPGARWEGKKEINLKRMLNFT